jgi:thymidylate synthase-like protein
MTPTIPTYPTLNAAIKSVQQHLRIYGSHIVTESWQGKKEPPRFYEALDISFASRIPKTLYELQDQVKPNLPWADNHFMERIGGHGINPGEQYKYWPFYPKDQNTDEVLREMGGKFSHTYMERFWPKYCEADTMEGCNRMGIRFAYGDFSNLINILKKEPHTRQAYLPIWFPEDLVAAELGKRVPCTLGYHFIRRGHNLNITYYIRSCDFFRHFRDDIYMACRLVYAILDQLKADKNEDWHHISAGNFSMHITSLHIWAKEYKLLND